MNKLQRGFTIIEGLLIFVIVGLIAGTGWYVYDSHKKAEKSLDTAASTNQTVKTIKKTESSVPADSVTTNWLKVTSGKAAFVVRVPDGWKLQNWTSRDSLSADSYSDIKYSAGTKANVTNGDGVTRDSGPDYHFSIGANPISEKKTIGYYFDDQPQNFGPVSGITGKKYIHVYDSAGDGISKGDKLYQYRFEGTKTLITVRYYVLNGEVNQDELVEKSIKTITFDQ